MNTISIKNVDIKAITDILSKAMSKDKKRKELCGVNIRVDDDGNYTATATNGHIMFVKGEAMDWNEGQDFIIPDDAIKALRKLKVKACDIDVDENGLIDFIVDTEVVLQAQRIDGRYPNYRICIPQYYDNSVTFQAGELQKAIKQLNDVVVGPAHRVQLVCEKDVLKVCNTIPCYADESEYPDLKTVICKVPAITNNDHGICFNLDYIKKAIARFCKSDWVTLKFNSPVGASLWCAEKGDSWTTLLMPVR